MLKSNVEISGSTITLKFRAKGGKQVMKAVEAARLVPTIKVLQRLPGSRLFLYQDGDDVRSIRARDVNAFLCEVASCNVSCKDFRALRASINVVETLLRTNRAEGPTRRKRQVRKAIQAAADDLTNTITICRKSYVHEAVVEAFERGKLGSVKKSASGRYPPARQILAEVISAQEVR